MHIHPGLAWKDIHKLLDTHACSSVAWWALEATFRCSVEPHPVVPGLIWEISTYLQPHLSPQHPPQPREVGRSPLHTQLPCQDPELSHQQQPRHLPCSCNGLVPCRNRLSTSFASALRGCHSFPGRQDVAGMRKLCVRLTSLSGFQSSVDTPLSFQEDTHHREGSCSNRDAVACMRRCPSQAIIDLIVCMHDPI